MKKIFPLTEFENIEKLPEIKLKTKSDDYSTISKEKIHYRRLRINKLRLQGYTNYQIAERVGCNLSTIEKDLHAIRENLRNWFKTESITHYCCSLYDSITLYDYAIEELQLLYQETDEIKTKITILEKFEEFEENKLRLFEKTKAVQNYLGEQDETM